MPGSNQTAGPREGRIRYRVYSTRAKSEGWYRTREYAIAAFERQFKREGVKPPLHSSTAEWRLLQRQRRGLPSGCLLRREKEGL